MRKFFNEILDMFVISIGALIPLAIFILLIAGIMSFFTKPACSMEKLGTISRNPFIGDSTANPFSMYNNPFNPNSPRNHFGPYGNPFSPYSANNPYSTQSPGIYGYADDSYAPADPYADYGDGDEGGYE